ncbi:metallophosphoesterase [Clostridium ganghwense]|uniref:Metallophosphoesterase n=1 Tax=Clostridium ganghwense TaxID=312089 RepID=A0ABT4CL22_9CLOT|nr:metallophosphoesterase [Clostridium ganghwense]MCY6369739.1 metallophosphoesterase [Clostridium ganghwense]
MKKKIIIFTLCLGIFFYFQNNFITVNNLEIKSEKIPEDFIGYKIVHLSDLHNKSFGNNQKHLVQKIKKIKPDLIVFTGDIIDRRRYNEKPSLCLIEEITKLAPVYYVTGNHEIWSGKFHTLEKKLKQNGAKVLRNEGRVINKGNSEMLILGIDDPAINSTYETEEEVVDKEIKQAMIKKYNDKYKILLSHRPEKFLIYSENNIDLIFSGHAHGGQVRLPFIGGIIAPNQGFFPKYTKGKYQDENSTMVVSRGLGNSLAPLRIFNRPEIVVVTLYKK